MFIYQETTTFPNVDPANEPPTGHEFFEAQLISAKYSNDQWAQWQD